MSSANLVLPIAHIQPCARKLYGVGVARRLDTDDFAVSVQVILPSVDGTHPVAYLVQTRGNGGYGLLLQRYLSGHLCNSPLCVPRRAVSGLVQLVSLHSG